MKSLLILFAAGILSTMVMDICGGLLRATRITAGAPPALVGKWLESSLKGTVFVGDIRSSPGEPVSLKKFLLYHYIIGILLTFILYAVVVVLKITPVPWWVTMLYGFATTLIPLLLMYPAMGFGFLGLKGPAEFLLLRTAVLNHLAFGLGLTFVFQWVLKL